MDNKDFSRQSMDDIVFDNRNKNYGAYVLRESYQTHLLKAIGLTFGLFILGLYSPKMAGAMGLLKEKVEPIKETITICPIILPEEFKVPPMTLPDPIQTKQYPSPSQRFTEVKPVDRTTLDELPKIDELKGKTIGNTTNTGEGGGDNKDPKIISSEGDPIITEIDTKEYKNVDQRPEFIGGHDAMIEFLKGMLVYPKDELENEVEGETLVNFVVGIDGNVENITLSKSSGIVNFDREAIRVIKKIGKRFRPGKINGKAVRTICSIPIDFIIE
jgi:periplasmic protein TonB